MFQIELASRKEMSVPTSWGVAKGGKESIYPKQILDGGGLLPLGGHELSGWVTSCQN